VIVSTILFPEFRRAIKRKHPKTMELAYDAAIGFEGGNKIMEAITECDINQDTQRWTLD